MIIVSQDKEEIVNFNKIENVWICTDGEGRFSIEAAAHTNSRLGYYKTKERAKEVLQEIIHFYRHYSTAKCSRYANVLRETTVYEMPED